MSRPSARSSQFAMRSATCSSSPSGRVPTGRGSRAGPRKTTNASPSDRRHRMSVSRKRAPRMSPRISPARHSRLPCVTEPYSAAVLGGFRQEQAELLAAVARAHVGGAGLTGQQVADRFEQLIAARMAVLVVELFEMIDVGEQQRDRLAIPPRARHLFAQPLLERAMVVKAGQAVFE